jgi:hypothetical protein
MITSPALPMPPIPTGPRLSSGPVPLDWVDEVQPAEPEVMPRGLKVGLVLALLSLIVLTRFGINTGSYGLNFAVPVLYVMLFAGFAKDRVDLDLPGLLLFAFFITCGALALIINLNMPHGGGSSTASLILLAVLYLPFVFVLKPFSTSREAWLWTMKAFIHIATVIAVLGILQFCLQFVWRPAWLFNFSPFIPKAISVDVLFNSQIYTGSAYKANGFFLREPSAFSFLMAFALICEMAVFKRWWRMGLFAAGLMLSYSGTGLLALAFGLMFPFSLKTAVRLTLIAVTLVLVYLLFTVSRIGEFNSESSSGYIRYVAPMRLVSELIDSDAWTALLGHGPGTIFHATKAFDYHDPTWAKLLYEYGFLGTAGCLGLMAYTMSRSHAPVQIRAMLFFNWLVQGGHLLTPESVLMCYVLLAVWPAPEPVRRRFATSTMPMTEPPPGDRESQFR